MHFCLSVLLIFSYTCIIMWCIWFTACWLNIICINIKVWCVNLNTLRLWLWEVLGILIPLFDCSVLRFLQFYAFAMFFILTRRTSVDVLVIFVKRHHWSFTVHEKYSCIATLFSFFFSVIHDLFTKLFTCNCTALSNFWK